MQINNPFQINDWEIKKFLLVILAIQIAVIGVIIIDSKLIDLPIIRPIITFIYLCTVPGLLILRVLRLHNLTNTQVIMYTVGLSLGTLMLTGFFINLIYPIIGIPNPISTQNIIFVLTIVVLSLCALCYMRDNQYATHNYLDIKTFFSNPFLVLCMLPILSLIGAYVVNYYHSNVILMILIIGIALIALLIGFNKFIPGYLYPFAIFSMAISLLYSNSFITNYLYGWDIHQEYYYANLVLSNGVWDPTLPNNLNAMLSLVMLGPIFSNVCGISLTWVFKIIYPFLFSFVPIGLFEVVKKQTNEKVAFLSMFFFISISTFNVEMLFLARQEIAEIFCVLLIMLMTSPTMKKTTRSFMFIVFSFSMIVSHYGLSYIYMCLLIIVWIIIVIFDNPIIMKLRRIIYLKLNKAEADRYIIKDQNEKRKMINLIDVIIYLLILAIWYIYVAQSIAFVTMTDIVNNIFSHIFTDLFDPNTAQGLQMFTIPTLSPLHTFFKYAFIICQIFILIGVVTSLLIPKKFKFTYEFKIFSILSLFICFGTIAIPFFASTLNTTRLYHISLMFLAPFCVIGGIATLYFLSFLLKSSWNVTKSRISFSFISIFLIMIMLFSTGLIYEVTNDAPSSPSLSQNNIENGNNTMSKLEFYDMYNVAEQDVYCGGWFNSVANRSINYKVYTDIISSYPLTSYGMTPVYNQSFIQPNEMINKNGDYISYVFLGYFFNVKKITLEQSFGDLYLSDPVKLYLAYNTSNEVYTNGGGEIYAI